MSERYRIVKASLIQTDYLSEIDQLYEFPADDSLALWKVVRTIHCLDQFRNFVISNIRWDKATSPVSIDKRRAVYVLSPGLGKALNVSFWITTLDSVYHGATTFPGSKASPATTALGAMTISSIVYLPTM